jgi:hypothetical protein
MKLSELINQLNDLAVKQGPDNDPEVIIRSEHPWKFVRFIQEDKVATVMEVKTVIAIR